MYKQNWKNMQIWKANWKQIESNDVHEAKLNPIWNQFETNLKPNKQHMMHLNTNNLHGCENTNSCVNLYAKPTALKTNQ